jgi:2-C-methyl-D-erythritol 4-phosphate cytidylyltransferase
MATKMAVKKLALKAKTTRAIDVQARDVFVLHDVARVVIEVGVMGRARVIHAATGRVGAIAVNVLQKRHVRLGENDANAVIRTVVKRYPGRALMYGLAEVPEERA